MSITTTKGQLPAQAGRWERDGLSEKKFYTNLEVTSTAFHCLRPYIFQWFASVLFVRDLCSCLSVKQSLRSITLETRATCVRTGLREGR